MAGAPDLIPSLLLNTPLRLWKAMLDDQKWEWAEAWLTMNPALLDPNDVLSSVLGHEGGGHVADRLGVWALDQGADPQRQMRHQSVHGLPLPLAVLTHRPALTARLLEDSRASQWLQTPWVGDVPLAHQLMKQGRYAEVKSLMIHGLPMRQAWDGSWPWEHAPIPSDEFVRAGNPLPSVQLALRLKDMEALPTTPKEWQDAVERMNKGVPRAEQARLRDWLNRVAEYSVVTTGEEKQAQYVKDLVAAWVQVSPASKSHPTLQLSKGVQQATQELPPALWTQPVALPHLAARAGTWTLAAAVAWVHAMLGPNHTPADTYNVNHVAPFAWWEKLATVPTDDPVWDTPVFSERGFPVTLRGLRSVATLESGEHTSLTTGQRRTPVAPGRLEAEDYAAALNTLSVAVRHWGSKRREAMGTSDWVSGWLVPSAKALENPLPAQKWGQEDITPVARLKAVLGLQKSMENLAMNRVLKALVDLTPQERNLIKPTQWRICAQYLKGDPTWLLETDADKNPFGVDLLDNPLLQEKRLLNPNGSETSVITQATMEGGFLLAPLKDPNSPLSQRLTRAVQAYWHVSETIPEQFHTYAWTDGLRRLQQTPADVTPEYDSPGVDKINWWVGWHTHRMGKSAPQGADWKVLWDDLRALYQAGQPLPEPLAKAIQPLFQLDPDRPELNARNWVSNWVKDVEAGLAEAPWQWLPQVGVPLTEAWREVVLKEAQQAAVYPRLEAQLRQAEAHTHAPDRARRRLRS